MQNLQIYLEKAIEAAQAAQIIIQDYYNQYEKNPEVFYKSDESPVTQADIDTEKKIKEILQKNFPDHGFYGEELGQEGVDRDFLWLIDPIDGTKAYVRRYPIFSTQIALMYRGELILGVSNAPAWNGGKGEMAYAVKGQGAYLNGVKIQVSDVATLNKATLSTGNIASLARNKNAWQNLGELMPKVHRMRGYGDFFHYHLLASGKIDFVIESDVNILDIAALSVIVNEAGGDFTDLLGNKLDLNTRSVLASNGKLRHLLPEFALN